MKVSGKIATWVFCMVFLAIIILQSGNYSYVQDNSYQNYGPSGTSAFLELIKRSRYKVQLDESRSPKLSKAMVIPVSKTHQKSFVSYLKSIKSETTIVTFIIPEEDKKPTKPTPIKNDVGLVPVGQMEPIRIKSELWQKPQLEDADSVDLLSSADGETTIAQVVQKDKIRLIQVLDAGCITNHFIEKVDNASIAMGLIAMAAKPGESVTYVGSFTSRDLDDSLLAKLGRPFEAAWSQILILILVIFITLSIRFGLPPESRAKQRGGRELVDGLAWMARRKKSYRWALRAVLDRVLSELERRHRVSRETIVQRPDLYLSPEYATVLKDAEAATMNDISEQEALSHAKNLKRLV